MSETGEDWPWRSGAKLRALAAGAPKRSLRQLVGAGPVFVLAPHPDDESIGCGGLIAACAAAGVRVFVRFLTDGRHSHLGSHAFPPELVGAIRRQEALRALRLLGVAPQQVRFERLIDGAVLFDTAGAERIAARIAREIRRGHKPVLLAPGLGDRHPDHMAAAAMADAIAARAPRLRLLRYFIWLGGDAPGQRAFVRFPIAAWRAKKARAIRTHRSQTTRLVHDVQQRTAPDLDGFLGAYEIFAVDARPSRSFST